MRFAILKSAAAAILKLAAVAAIPLGLSACASTQTGIAAASTPIYVDKVDVQLAGTVTSTKFGEALKAKTRREATRFARAGKPHALRISVTDVHYKNAALSLLIGDGNRASAHVQVIDPDTGKVRNEFDASTAAIGSYVINGVVGAVIAVAQKKDDVDEQLADGLASDVLEKIYGSAAAKDAKTRPALDVAEEQPAAAPAMPGAKPAPKAAPKAVAPKTAALDGRTAMAAPAAPAPVAR